MRAPAELFSIIIVVKNDRGLSQTLDHIRPFYKLLPCETIVVDSSEPSVLADIKAANPWVLWEQYPPSTQRTTPQQRNRGIAMAKGDVIVFIDANCIPERSWLTALAASIADGERIVCGPVKDLSEENLVHYAPELEEGKYVDVCTTINVAIRKEVIDRVGSFDTSFRFGQDVDFFWRAKDAGYKIYYNPQAGIGHDWGKRHEQLRRAFDYGKSRAHLYKKHWRTHWKQLRYEPHVWIYPLFILGLPLMLLLPIVFGLKYLVLLPLYFLLILVPIIKNHGQNPIGLVMHHMTYGVGVIAGLLTRWPVDQDPRSVQGIVSKPH